MYVSALDPDHHLSVFNLKSTPFPDILAVFIDSYHTDPQSTALKLLLWPRADPLLTLLRGPVPGSPDGGPGGPHHVARPSECTRELLGRRARPLLLGAPPGQ